MKVFVHYEGTPDLTWLVEISSKSKDTVESLISQFIKAYNETNGSIRKISTESNVFLSTSRKFNQKKAIPPTTLVSTIVENGTDLFFHIAASEKSEPIPPQKPAPVMMTQPAPSVSKPLKKHKSKSEVEEIEKQMHLYFLAGSYRLSRDIALDALKEDDTLDAAYYTLGLISMRIDKYDKAVIDLEKAVRLRPLKTKYLIALGQARLANGELEEALSTFQLGHEYASSDSESGIDAKEFEVAIASVMRKNKNFDTAKQLVAGVLRKEKGHLNALIEYLEILHTLKEEEKEQLKVIIQVIAKDQRNPIASKYFAGLVSRQSTIDELCLLLPPESSAAAYSYFALIVSQYSEITGALKLATIANRESKNQNGNIVLCLSHLYEFSLQVEQIINVTLEFVKKNKSRKLGSLNFDELVPILEDLLPPECSVPFDKYLNAPYLSVPFTPFETQTEKKKDKLSAADLDAIAIFATALKTMFIQGRLNECSRLLKLVGPCRLGYDIDSTPVKNENAIFTHIEKLIPFVPKASVDGELPRIYVVGDDHALTIGWQRIVYRGVKHVLVPCVISGCKIYHLRKESTSPCKYQFEKVIQSIPKGSKIILLLGELDCREGVLGAMEKCAHENASETMQYLIMIYTDTVKKLVEKYDHDVWVHPAPTVLDDSRAVALQFNLLLAMSFRVAKSANFLDFHNELLSVDGKLRKDLELDGTHLNPAYTAFIEKYISKGD